MNSKIKASLVAGGLALAGFVSSANAAVISYSEDFSFGSTTINDTTNNGSAVSNSQSQTFNLSGFDSSLGTLTGVSIYFDTDWELTSRLVAKDPGLALGSYGEGTASSEMKVSLTNPTGSDNSTIESLVSSCVSFKAFNARCRDTESVNGDFNDSLDLGGIALSSFVDTILSFEVTRNLLADLTDCGLGDNCKLLNKNNSWAGDLVVSYEYDDGSGSSSVPEPAMLAVFGLGLLGFSAARRKKA